MIAFVQARMGSTRLPGKILKELPNGQTLIERIFQQIADSGHTPYLITSENVENQALISLATRNHWPYFQGDETDVLHRFIAAAEHFSIQPSTHILRICADNPFISKTLINDTVLLSHQFPNADYLSYAFHQIPGIKLHAGIFSEIVKISALQAIHLSNNPWFNEHVTIGIYSNPELFNVQLLEIPEPWQDRFEEIRLTIDDDVDWQLAQDLFPIFQNQDFSEFRTTLLSNKNWVNLMAKQIAKYQK
ncbi:MAG: cytidylyltransferase domain-containing protein [Bacteroidota bacterium]|jgi:spore coat polysaccharide biosynthesis protein SpsF